MKILIELLLLIRPVLPSMLLALLLSVACMLSSIGLMGTAAYLIASAALMPELYELSLAIVGVRCFGISRAIFRYAERYVAHSATFLILSQLRCLVYERLACLGQTSLNKLKTSELCALLLKQVDTLKDFYLRVLAPVLTAGIVLLAISSLFAFYAMPLAYISIGAFFLISVVIPYSVYRKNRHALIAAKAQQTALTNQCVDAIQGLTELTAWNQTAATLAKLQTAANLTANYQYKAARITALTGALSEAIAAGALVVAMYIIIPMVNDHKLTGIDFAVLVLMLQSSFEAAFAVPAVWHYYILSQHAALQIFALPSSKITVTANAPKLCSAATSPLLAIDNLQFAYPGEPAILHAISFTLNRGEHIAIVGASGVGKSTLAALLLKLTPTTNLPIKLNGQLYQFLSDAEVCHNFNFVAQETHIFKATIQENLQILHPTATPAKLHAALAKAELADFIAALPHGIDTPIGQNGSQLSGGQRQRLALARAFLRPAPIMLLDEPTAGLDRLTASKILHTIFSQSTAQAIILITHDLTNLRQMDKILVLCNGTIAEQGTYQELINRRGLFWQMRKFS